MGLGTTATESRGIELLILGTIPSTTCKVSIEYYIWVEGGEGRWGVGVSMYLYVQRGEERGGGGGAQQPKSQANEV